MRLLLAAALLLAGALTGVAAVAVHGRWWGLALGAAAVLVTLVALPAGWTTRLPFALGVSGVVLWLGSTRPEGDLLVAGDARGYLVLLVAVVVVVGGIATLPRPRRRPDRGPSEDGPVRHLG